MYQQPALSASQRESNDTCIMGVFSPLLLLLLSLLLLKGGGAAAVVSQYYVS
jgi:hypothetical protein